MTKLEDVAGAMVVVSAIIAFGTIVIAQTVLGEEKIDFQKAKVTSTFLYGGTTACYYDRAGNTDVYYNGCPFHTGDNVTVYHDGMGVWYIQK